MVFGGFVLTEFTIVDIFAQEDNDDDSVKNTDDAKRDLAIVAINKDNTDGIGTGAVYIFDENYSLIKTLDSPENPQYGQFNGDITYADGNILILSTSSRTSSDYDHLQPGAAPQEGAVSFFDGTTGSFIQTIRNPEPNTLKDYVEGRFGSSVIYAENKIIIGNSARDVNGVQGAGAVYVFDKNTGELLSKIDNPNPAKYDDFGISLAALDENSIAVGVPGKKMGKNEDAGAVMIFDVNSGSMTKIIKAPNPGPYDKFSHSIDITENKLLVGAPNTIIDDKAQAGQVYVYDIKTWKLLHTIENPDPDDNDLFGLPVIFAGDDDGEKIVVGAVGDGTFEEGAVHIFDAESGRHLETINSPQKFKDGVYTNNFGRSLSVAGERLAIGDPGKIFGDKRDNVRTGGAYIFDITTGELLQTIDNPVSDSSDAFGYHLGFVGDMENSSSSFVSSQDVNTTADVVFTTPQNISNTSKYSVFSHVATDGENIYVMWTDMTSTGRDTEVLFSKSVDGGENFSIPKKINGNSGTWMVTSVTVDEKNIFVTLMDRFEDKSSEILFSKSIDGGETFSEPKRISDKTSFASGAEIAINGENIFVTWYEGDFREWEIFFSKSVDGGEVFSEPQNLSNNDGSSTFPSIVTDGTEIFITWQDDSSGINDIFLSMSTDGGETFSEPKNISNIPNSSVGSHLVTDGTNLYLIWFESDQKSIRNLFFSKSVDGGEVFSEPQNISSNSREYSSSPFIETDGKNIFVIWSDSNSKMGNVFFSSSADRGETFSEPKNISNKEKDFSDGNSMTTDGKNIFVTWTDRFLNENPPSEIFFSRSSTELQSSITNESNINNHDDIGNEIWVEPQRTTLSVFPGTLEFNKVPDGFVCDVKPKISYTYDIESNAPVVYPQHDSLVVRIGGEDTKQDFEMMIGLQYNDDNDSIANFADDLSYNFALTEKEDYTGTGGGGLSSPDGYSDYSTLGVAVEASSSVNDDGILESSKSRIVGLFPSDYVTPIGIASNGDYILDVKMFDSEEYDWIDSDRCGIQAVIPIAVNGTDDVTVGQIQFSNIKVSALETNHENQKSAQQILDDAQKVKSIKWINELGADYAVGGFGAIKMVHPGLNANRQLIDIPVVHVWSDTDPQGIQVEAIETGADTGVFYADVDFVDNESSHLQIYVSDGDIVTASFKDNLTDTVKIAALSKMEWSNQNYLASGTGMLHVTDHSMNMNQDRIDTFDIQVWSDSDPKGIDITMVETDEATGIFQGNVTFTASDESSGHRLRVIHGDTVVAKYDDITAHSRIIDLFSPLKQQKSGVLPEDITCRDGLEKIFRSDKGATSCAKPLSVEKLIQRGGWTLDK